jgi:hypothetical protein
MKTSTQTGWALGILATTAAAMLGLGCQPAEAETGDGARDGMPPGVERLAEDLSLNEEQRGHIEAVRSMLAEHHEARVADREARFQELRTMVETGEVDSEQVHGRIDEKIDEVRGLAHRVADELIALVESLEPDQRSRAVEHIDRFHERMVAFHERVEASGGPRAFFARLRERGCGGPAGWLDE